MIFISFMILSIILFAFMGGEKIVVTGSEKGKIYCFVMGASIFLIGALRATSVGYDTGNYARHFYECATLSWSQLFQEYGDEPFYYILCKLVLLVTDNHQWVFAIVSLSISYAVSKFIYRYSRDFMVSYMMLVPMMYFGFFLTAQRQVMALSIILLSIPFIREKQFWKFSILIALAFFFHHSAVFAFPLYFITNSRMKPFHYLIAILVFVVVYIGRRFLLTTMLVYFYSEYEAYETESGTIVTLLMYVGIWLLLLFSKRFIPSNEKPDYYEKCLMIGIMIQSFVPLEPNIFRLAFYYLIFSLISVPLVIHSLPKGFIKPVAKISFIVLMFILFTQFTYETCGVTPYLFFWEHPFLK